MTIADLIFILLISMLIFLGCGCCSYHCLDIPYIAECPTCEYGLHGWKKQK